MYKYIFGPVLSRRLGMSLGVDLVPHKVCSLNCVYCECGPTTDLTIERKEYVSYDLVTKELDKYLSANPAPDYITFSGAGEPTLNVRIGDVIKFIKNKNSDIPVAVLTNGSLFFQKEVREELLSADLVLPSLDAASDPVFHKINRPFQSLNFKEYLKGLQEFRKEYKGRIWLEVLILPGYNDSESDLELFRIAFNKIQPDVVQLNTLDRPGTIESIRAATGNELEKIADFWGLENLVVVAAPSGSKDKKIFRKDIESAILETISRRPCTQDDLSMTLGINLNETDKYLKRLESNHKINKVMQSRGLFYQLKK
jgi:wyosine [tRNA(Phe)-imidazoG37] synthetase (radical SAM superfamily)